MIPRMTTIGTLKNYRYDLNRSNNTMASSMNKLITQRNFNSYAENPAMATRCFQLRRSFQRTSSQLSVNDSVWHKYDVAWQALGGVTDDLYDIVNETSDSGFKSILTSLNDADASGRNALGQSMAAKAKSIIQTMNGRYGENYVFSGADHLEVPFTWDPMENPDYIQNPDPKNEEHAKAFRYMIDPNSTEAQDGQLYTDDPALAKQVGEPNPRYDEKYTQEVLDAANPDPDPDAMKDPRFGKYLLADGSGTTNTDDPNLVKRVPEENPKYNPNSSFKYLDAKGEGTNFESAAQTVLCYRGVAVNSMSEEELSEIKEKVMPHLEKARTNHSLNMIFFMLTNIITESSELLCAGPEAREKLINAFDLRAEMEELHLKGVVSRKKQLVPALVEALQQ